MRNDGVNGIDYLGADCIAITDRIAVSWPFYHYAIEKIEGCCPKRGEETSYSDTINEETTSEGKVELLNITGFTAENYRRKRLGPPHRTIKFKWGWQRVSLSPNGISFVHYDVYEKSSRKFVNVFDGKPSEVKKKWKTIISLAKSYAYAEQGTSGERIEPRDAKFTRFPKSLYNAFGNNSNTFVRTIVTDSGVGMQELSGWHPGNQRPDPNGFNWSQWRNPKAKTRK